MTDPSVILRQMINAAPGEVENIDANITQVDEQIADLEDKIDGVENGLCAVAASDLASYLDGTKLIEIELIYGTPLNTPFSVDYGPEYGTIDYSTGGIIDWEIIDSTGNTMYKYLSTNWDGDSTIIQFISDYAFGNDYLTHPLGTDAFYGLYPLYDILVQSKTMLENNKAKIEQSETTFEGYAS